jgi:hypothetical protein
VELTLKTVSQPRIGLSVRAFVPIFGCAHLCLLVISFTISSLPHVLRTVIESYIERTHNSSGNPTQSTNSPTWISSLRSSTPSLVIAYTPTFYQCLRCRVQSKSSPAPSPMQLPPASEDPLLRISTTLRHNSSTLNPQYGRTKANGQGTICTGSS